MVPFKIVFCEDNDKNKIKSNELYLFHTVNNIHVSCLFVIQINLYSVFWLLYLFRFIMLPNSWRNNVEETMIYWRPSVHPSLLRTVENPFSSSWIWRKDSTDNFEEVGLDRALITRATINEHCQWDAATILSKIKTLEFIITSVFVSTRNLGMSYCHQSYTLNQLKIFWCACNVKLVVVVHVKSHFLVPHS